MTGFITRPILLLALAAIVVAAVGGVHWISRGPDRTVGRVVDAFGVEGGWLATMRSVGGDETIVWCDGFDGPPPAPGSFAMAHGVVDEAAGHSILRVDAGDGSFRSVSVPRWRLESVDVHELVTTLRRHDLLCSAAGFGILLLGYLALRLAAGMLLGVATAALGWAAVQAAQAHGVIAPPESVVIGLTALAGFGGFVAGFRRNTFAGYFASRLAIVALVMAIGESGAAWLPGHAGWFELGATAVALVAPAFAVCMAGASLIAIGCGMDGDPVSLGGVCLGCVLVVHLLIKGRWIELPPGVGPRRDRARARPASVATLFRGGET